MRIHTKSLNISIASVLWYMYKGILIKYLSNMSYIWTNHKIHSYSCYVNVKCPYNKALSHQGASSFAPCWAGFPSYLELS